MLVQLVFGHLSFRTRTPALAVVGGAQQIAVGYGVRPVVAAGVVHAHQHLAPAPQRGQGLQRLLRQGRQAKDDHPARQPRGPRALPSLRRRHEAPVYLGSAAGCRCGAHIVPQRPPEPRLPGLFGGHRLHAPSALGAGVAAVRPVGQPVGPVDLVLVQQVGQALGQLVAFAQVLVLRQKALQRGERGVLQQGGQQAHQAPGQWLGVQGRVAWHRVGAQHGPVSLPDEAHGQLHLQRRGDAMPALGRVLRQRQAQPLRHAVALHQDALILQRRQRVAAHPVTHQVAQRLGVVAMHHHEAGGQAGGQGLFGRHGRHVGMQRAHQVSQTVVRDSGSVRYADCGAGASKSSPSGVYPPAPTRAPGGMLGGAAFKVSMAKPAAAL